LPENLSGDSNLPIRKHAVYKQLPLSSMFAWVAGEGVVQAISVAVADNHPLIVDGLSNIFASHSEYRLVSIGRSLAEAFDIARQQEPEILILEPGMDGRSYDCIAQITKVTKSSVLAFTSLSGVEPAVRAFDAGAKAYTLKSNPVAELLSAMSAIRSGDTYITPIFATKVIMALRNDTARRKTSPAIKLSFREEKIVQMLLAGRTNKEIGMQLDIREKTVKHYMTILMQKFHVRNRLEVLLAAQKLASGESAGNIH
jgi:DNA-binding NarL/FixJ family response regulator